MLQILHFGYHFFRSKNPVTIKYWKRRYSEANGELILIACRTGLHFSNSLDVFAIQNNWLSVLLCKS